MAQRPFCTPLDQTISTKKFFFRIRHHRQIGSNATVHRAWHIHIFVPGILYRILRVILQCRLPVGIFHRHGVPSPILLLTHIRQYRVVDLTRGLSIQKTLGRIESQRVVRIIDPGVGLHRRLVVVERLHFGQVLEVGGERRELHRLWLRREVQLTPSRRRRLYNR